MRSGGTSDGGRRAAPPPTWRRVLLACLPTLLLFVVAESATRAFVWFRFGSPDYGMRWTFEYEPYLVTRRTGNPAPGSLPDDGRFCVVLVGGSTAAQVPVPVLEESLSRRLKRAVRVVNLGEGGFILNQTRIRLLLEGTRLRPDLVISLDGANDLVTASKGLPPGQTYQADFVRFAVDRPLTNAALSIARKSQLVNSLNKLLERRREVAYQSESAAHEQLMGHMVEAWHSIAAISRGLDAHYLLVLQPYLHLRSDLHEAEEALASHYGYRKRFLGEMYREVSERLGRQDLPGSTRFVDGTEAFDSTDRSVQCFIDEVHLTADGNAILSDVLAREAALLLAVAD